MDGGRTSVNNRLCRWRRHAQPSFQSPSRAVGPNPHGPCGFLGQGSTPRRLWTAQTGHRPRALTRCRNDDLVRGCGALVPVSPPHPATVLRNGLPKAQQARRFRQPASAVAISRARGAIGHAPAGSRPDATPSDGTPAKDGQEACRGAGQRDTPRCRAARRAAHTRGAQLRHASRDRAAETAHIASREDDVSDVAGRRKRGAAHEAAHAAHQRAASERAGHHPHGAGALRSGQGSARGQAQQRRAHDGARSRDPARPSPRAQRRRRRQWRTGGGSRWRRWGASTRAAWRS